MLTEDVMNERDITPDELERFERKQVHHEDENPEDNFGPASEPEIGRKQSLPPSPTLPPNPD